MLGNSLEIVMIKRGMIFTVIEWNDGERGLALVSVQRAA
jgi:hypothetical protein